MVLFSEMKPRVGEGGISGEGENRVVKVSRSCLICWSNV